MGPPVELCKFALKMAGLAQPGAARALEAPGDRPLPPNSAFVAL
jgi:hypothetical protein